MITTVGSGGQLNIEMFEGSFTNENDVIFAAQGGTGMIAVFPALTMKA